LRIGTPYPRRPAPAEASAEEPLPGVSFARAVVKIAGRICKTREREWWADLAFVQLKRNESGLGLAVSCLLSAPGLAWPELRLRAIMSLAEFLFDLLFSVVRLCGFLVLRAVVWSPAVVGAAVGMALGVLAIGVVDTSGVVLVVLLAGTGLCVGRTYPTEVMRVAGSAGGSAFGIALGQLLWGNLSIGLFVAPGLVFGAPIGATWAHFSSRLETATGADVAALVMKAALNAARDAKASYGAVDRALKEAHRRGAARLSPHVAPRVETTSIGLMAPVNASNGMGELMIRAAARSAEEPLAPERSAARRRSSRRPGAGVRRRPGPAGSGKQRK